MPVSEMQKKARNKWDAANMTVLGCKIRKDKAERFKAACMEAGTTVNAVFTAAMDSFLEQSPRGNIDVGVIKLKEVSANE
ncbi:MAG: hypothetical protein IJU78_05275 [Clostridia bacterium]|nr:hypothetical protein [Clostridia bacterium]